jgi:hypothetical protein
MAGADLVSRIFMNTLLRIFTTWAVETEFVQKAMQNLTTRVENARYLKEFEERYELPGRYEDEL